MWFCFVCKLRACLNLYLKKTLQIVAFFVFKYSRELIYLYLIYGNGTQQKN